MKAGKDLICLMHMTYTPGHLQKPVRLQRVDDSLSRYRR
jgi:hypothetical protein